MFEISKCLILIKAASCQAKDDNKAWSSALWQNLYICTQVWAKESAPPNALRMHHNQP
jgi:hypothetical protein